MSLTRALSPFLPRESTGRREQKVWMALLLLCPLAYAGGIWIERYQARDFPIHPQVSRAGAIELARQFARSQGVAADGWNAYCVGQSREDQFVYQERFQNTAAELARRVTPANSVEVILQSPSDGKRWLLVSYALDGRRIGYDLHLAAEGPVRLRLDEAAAQTLAQAQLARDFPAGGPLRFGRPEVRTLDSDGSTRQYTWRSTVAGTPELEFQTTVILRGATLVGQSVRSTLDPLFVERVINPHRSLLFTFSSLYSLFLLALGIYSLYRYLRRSLAQEISHQRTLLVAAVSGAFLLINLLSSQDQQVYQQLKTGADSGPPAVLILLIFLLIAALAGILFGVAYGSAEGEMREAYPGRLTSLDGLILGRWTSRNVASSLIFGVAFAGWMLLMQSLLVMQLREASSLYLTFGLQLAFMRTPVTSMLLGQFVGTLIAAVGSLMLPVTIAHRHVQSPTGRVIVILLCATLAGSGSAAAAHSAGFFFVSIVVYLIALLVPFFRFDLLAALASYGAYAMVSSAIRLSPLFVGSATVIQWAGLLIALFCGVMMYFSYRGRTLSDEAVRPIYARRLAERISLQEEVAAAREAQLRLLPQAPPTTDGASFAAFCLPARVVGGDFYDFFPLAEGRIGILLAAGNTRGLASALTIALAKGFLMYTVRSTSSPTEVIVKLESALGSVLVEGAGRTSVAYAVLDPATGLLRYARTGTHPKILLSNVPAGQWERVVSVVGRENSREPIWEGSATLNPGDTALFYTRGVENRLAARWGRTQQRWLPRLVAQAGDSAEHLQNTLLTALLGQQTENEQQDDLTAVVLRAEQPHRRASECVA